MNHQSAQPMKTANIRFLLPDIKHFNKVSTFLQRRDMSNRGGDSQ